VIDLTVAPQRIHVVGVGGAGMSAIALVLSTMGHRVTGSDQRASAMLDRLAAAGVHVTVGAAPDDAAAADLVTSSTAIPSDDADLVAARSAGVPTISRATMLAAICATRPTLAVAGTHGKTTTSSLLALVLESAEFDPSFIIGGDVSQLGTGARWGSGEWFIAEADESDGTFLELPRVAAIVTNVEPDHLEHYGGFDGLRDAFDRFVVETDGPVVVCVDDPLTRELVGRVGASVGRGGAGRLVTYGTSPDADYHMADVVEGGREITWVVARTGQSPIDLRLSAPGLHNARNAMAATALALELGASAEAAAAALGSFEGVARRFEFRGTAEGVTFVDDYAHLPTEVAAAVEAAKGGGWERVVGVFQPHRFSRTEALWASFADSFDGLDQLVVCDIYPSGEAPRAGITAKLVVNAVLDAHPWSNVAWCPARADLIAYLSVRLRAGDLCLTLGAGDLTTLPDELIAALGAGR